MEDKIKKLEDTIYGSDGLLVKYTQLEAQLRYVNNEIRQLRNDVRQTKTLLAMIFAMTTVDFISVLIAIFLSLIHI